MCVVRCLRKRIAVKGTIKIGMFWLWWCLMKLGLLKYPATIPSRCNFMQRQNHLHLFLVLIGGRLYNTWKLCKMALFCNQNIKVCCGGRRLCHFLDHIR